MAKKPERESSAASSSGPKRRQPDRELIVTASAEAGLQSTTAGLTSAPGVDLESLHGMLAGAKLKPLFGLHEQRTRAAGMMSGAGQGAGRQLSRFYRVQGASQPLEELASRLAGHDAIDGAFVKPPAEPPIRVNDMVPAAQEPTTSPDFTSNQGYLEAAPAGVDARYAWTVAGGAGAGVRIIDVEGEWRFTHEDLRQNKGGVVGGTPPGDADWRNHGTAVLGEFGGDRNSFGITGICPDAAVSAISIFGDLGSAAAIRQAADLLAAGDIILIELHRPGPRFNFESRDDQGGYIPVEWWPDDFAAIQYATGRGIIVVEAGGNGSENLDDPLYDAPADGFPSDWANPFRRADRDSGAILVGAGAPPQGTHGNDYGPDRSRLDFSNYGSAVDAQGWGREVTSCGYGDLQGGSFEDLWYTNQFSGTSSASPIIVGVLGCAQGALRAAGGTLFSPATARDILRRAGSAQQDAPGRLAAQQRIGNRPDLRQILGTILLVNPPIVRRDRVPLQSVGTVADAAGNGKVLVTITIQVGAGV